MTPETPEDRARFGHNLASVRKERGMSQGQLADTMREAGFAAWRQTTVSRIERGEQKLKVQEVLALERLFGGKVTEGTAFTNAAKKYLTGQQQAMKALDESNLRGVAEALTEAGDELVAARDALKKTQDALDLAWAAIEVLMWDKADQEADDGEHPEAS